MQNPRNSKKARRRISRNLGATLAASAMLAATMPAQAGAQDAPEQCNGLDATIVVNDLSDPGAATDGDDVVVIDTNAAQNEDIFEALPLYLTLGGDDTVCVRDNTYVLLFTGAGADTVLFEGVNATGSIWAGSGDDLVTSVDSAELEVEGSSGDDTLIGGPGSDRLNGGDGNDIIRGGPGFDRLDGGSGDDEIHGGLDDDRINGGEGNDMLYGSQGDDNIVGGMGADTLYGGAGSDTLSATDMWTMNPHAESGVEDIAGSRLFGGAGDDMLWGSNRWDRMQGGAGDDMLAGFEGRDYMRGGSGNDELIGGGNIDDMNGNTGADRIFIDPNDKASGGFGQDECGGFESQNLAIPKTCETTFTTTMAMVMMNMNTGGFD